MNSTGCNQNQVCNEDNELDFHQFSFQYDWDNDNEWDISDEILSESVLSDQPKIDSPCSMKVHESRFSDKYFDSESKKKSGMLLRMRQVRSSECELQRVNRNLMWTVKRVRDNNCSLLDDVESEDLKSKFAQENLCKSSNMKDQIRGLLKLLVIESKKKAEIEKSKKFARSYDKSSFVTMKDIQTVNDSE